MKSSIVFILLAIMVVAIMSCTTGTSNTRPLLTTPRETAIATLSVNPANKFIIRTTNETQLKENLSVTDAQVKTINSQLVTVSITSKPAETLTVLKEAVESGNIAFIEPDYEVKLFNTFNDPEMEKQWAHKIVESEGAWAITKGRKGIIVGVIDTGVDYTHEDLKENIFVNRREIPNNGIDDDNNGFIDDVNGWDFVNNDNDPMADDTAGFHGTHVAGTIAAVGGNGVGGVGQAPNVTILPLKFLSSKGSGAVSDAIKAIDYGILMKAHILSNSWGGGSKSEALQDAIQRAEDAGILFVVAAGNGDWFGRAVDTDVKPVYPVSYPLESILGVAASTVEDKLTPWSNIGVKAVHLAAPGADIVSTRNGNTYASLSGTSMATPLVSGVAALVWSARPELSFRDVKKILLDSVDKSPAYEGKVYTGGRINAKKALELAKTYESQEQDQQIILPPTVYQRFR